MFRMAAPLLEFVDGTRPPIPLVEEEVVIGRGEGCAVRLEDAGVAERQLRLVRDLAGSMWVEPLAPGGQKGGVPIAGRLPLADGDELVIAGVRLRFRAGGEAEESTAITMVPESVRAALSRRLDTDEEEPHTTQMDTSELNALRRAAAQGLRAPVPATPPTDGPAPLPPPPTAESPPPDSEQLPPLPPIETKAALLAAFGPARVEGQTAAAGGVASKPPPVPRDPSAETTVPEPIKVRPPPVRPPPPTDPATQPNELPAEARHDPTTQPSIRAIRLPVRAHTVRRAFVLAGQLFDGPAGSVLIADVTWSTAVGGVIGCAMLLGRMGLAVIAAGLVLLGVTTWLASRRLVPMLVTKASGPRPVVQGLESSLVGVGWLRLGLLVAALGGGALAVVGVAAAVIGGALAGLALAAQAWLSTAYDACLDAWARACPEGTVADLELAPAPLRTALDD
jgi:hypothetical protein